MLPYMLIADDDPDDLLAFAEAFRIAWPDIRVVPLPDRDEVRPYLKDHDMAIPALMVLDYNMPKMSGAEVLRDLQGNAQIDSIPKVVLTSSDREVEMRECLELGATRVFIKQDNDKDLLRIVSEMWDLLAMGARHAKA